MKKILFLPLLAYLFSACSDSSVENNSRKNLLKDVKNIYFYYENNEDNLLNIDRIEDIDYLNTFIDKGVSNAGIRYDFFYNSNSKISSLDKYEYNSKIASFTVQYNNENEVKSWNSNYSSNSYSNEVTYDNNFIKIKSTSNSSINTFYSKLEYSGQKILKSGAVDLNGDYKNTHSSQVKHYNYNGSDAYSIQNKYIENGLEKSYTPLEFSDYYSNQDIEYPLYLIPSSSPNRLFYEVFLNLRLSREIPSKVILGFAIGGSYNIQKIINFNETDYLLIYTHSRGEEFIKNIYIIYKY